MNKEELIYCLDRARNGVVKVNNDEEGDFVVKKLKEFGSVCLVSKLPSEIKPQYPTHIGIGDNDWWTYSYPSGNLNVIEFEEFRRYCHIRTISILLTCCLTKVCIRYSTSFISPL